MSGKLAQYNPDQEREAFYKHLGGDDSGDLGVIKLPQLGPVVLRKDSTDKKNISKLHGLLAKAQAVINDDTSLSYEATCQTFGPLTEKVVKTVQKGTNLPQTGVVDKSTWSALYTLTGTTDPNKAAMDTVMSTTAWIASLLGPKQPIPGLTSSDSVSEPAGSATAETGMPWYVWAGGAVAVVGVAYVGYRIYKGQE